VQTTHEIKGLNVIASYVSIRVSVCMSGGKRGVGGYERVRER